MKNIVKYFFTIVFLFFIHNSAFCEDYAFSAIDAYNKGVELFEAKNYNGAIQAFNEAIKIEPSFTDAYYNLASIYTATKQYEKAITAYSTLLKIKPDDYDVIYELAQICYQRANYSTALKYIDYIPESYENYQAAAKLKNDAKYALNIQRERVNRAKVNTANVNKKIVIDQFQSPTGIAIDSSGNLYVACYSDNSIMRVSKDKKNTIFVKNQLINGPIGIAIDKFDNLYVANYEGNNILKIAPNGRTHVFMDKIYKPYSLYIKDDILYISEQTNNIVIKYQLN